MKRLALLISHLLISFSLFAQNRAVDSLKTALENEKTDTGKITLLYTLSQAYQNSKPDSALLLAREAYSMSKNKKFIGGESWSLGEMAVAYNRIGDFPKALEY